MKKILLTTALVLGMTASASAMTTYIDNEYGTFDDGSYVNIGGLFQNNSVTLNFNILDKGYNPSTEQIIAASLALDFWSEDPQDETVSVYAGMYDGDTLIKEQWYDLGGWEWWIFSGNEAATTTLNIDLQDFLSYTQDGLFTTIVLALGEECWDCDNDFRLEGATFSADAVPEPGTMLLMGAGLAGVAGFSRRRKK